MCNPIHMTSQHMQKSVDVLLVVVIIVIALYIYMYVFVCKYVLVLISISQIPYIPLASLRTTFWSFGGFGF